MGRLLFGILPFLFGRIWKRLAIAGGALFALALVMRFTGIAAGEGILAGAWSWVAFRLLLGLMALVMAAVLAAPFRVENDLLIPWALHRETGTPPALQEKQEAARQKIRAASKEMPKGGTWALGVRITYTEGCQIVWTPVQVLYGALGTFLGLYLLASIMSSEAMSPTEAIDGLYALPVILVGGAGGLIGGSIGRSFVEALLLGALSYAFTVVAALWSSVKLQPYLENVIPPLLYAQFWTLILARLLLPRLRRLGRLFHYALVGYVAPAAVVAVIFYLANSYVTRLRNSIGEYDTNVSWIWTTPDNRLLMAGHNKLYGNHWLMQRQVLGGFWSIDPKRKRLESLTPDRAVVPFMMWDQNWFLRRVPKLDRIALPIEPTETDKLLECRGTVSWLHTNGRIEELPDLSVEGPLEPVVRDAIRNGLPFDQKDIELISTAMGQERGPWQYTPFPRKSSVLITASRQVLFDLKNDRAHVLKERLDSPAFLIDGPRGREIIARQFRNNTPAFSRLSVYNLERQTLTGLTDFQHKLSLKGATDALVLVKYQDQPPGLWHNGVVFLDGQGEFKEFTWPEEKTVQAAVTPAGSIQVWTDRNLKLLDPANWEEKSIPRPKGMGKRSVGLKGYLGQDPILLIKTDGQLGKLRRLDLKSGKLETLVEGVFQ